MASGRIYKRGKNWYVDIYTGRKIEGKRERIQRRARGNTKADATAELAELLTLHGRAGAIGSATDNDFPVSILVEQWKKSIELQFSGNETYKEYCRHIDRILGDHHNKLVSDITPKLVEKELKKIVASQSTNTANKSLAKLKICLNFGMQNKLITSNPIIHVKALRPIRVKFRRALSHEEADALIEVASKSFKNIWLAFLDTGMRKAELENLKWQSVDFKNKLIRIEATEEWKPKTETGNRIIPMTQNLLEALQGMTHNGDYVFGTQCGDRRKNNLRRSFKCHMKNALYKLNGLPLRKNFSGEEAQKYKDKINAIKKEMTRLDIHALRYTFITELISNGADPKTAQYLAGHSDIQTTLNIYAQCKHENIQDAIKRLKR